MSNYFPELATKALFHMAAPCTKRTHETSDGTSGQLLNRKLRGKAKDFRVLLLIFRRLTALSSMEGLAVMPFTRFVIGNPNYVRVTTARKLRL